MKAIYKGKEVQIWQISKTAEQPEWIKAAFKANYLKWSGDKLLFIMNGVKVPVKISAWTNFKTLFNGASGWWATYASGYIGDYLDFTNRKIISERKFKKKYKIVDTYVNK